MRFGKLHTLITRPKFVTLSAKRSLISLDNKTAFHREGHIYSIVHQICTKHSQYPFIV